MTNIRRYIFPVLLVVIVFALSSTAVRERLFPNGDLMSSAEKLLDTPESKERAPVQLVLVGDIMMDRGVRRSVESNFSGDYSAFFAHTSYLKDADIAFANLEGTVAESGRNVGSRFSFHMKPVVASTLGDAGFDVVSFANNHVGDWDRAAFDETLLQLQEAQIQYAGAGTSYLDARTPRIVEVRGMKIGFLASTDVGPKWLAATDTKSGILLSSDPKLPDIVRAAKAQVDVLVVSFHWGNEYSPANTHQQTLAHTVIDAGADIVVGHHPHVMEKVEEYGPFGSAQDKKPIFYSLGNFIFDQYFSPHTMRGMVATVSIDPDTMAITHKEEVSQLSKQFVPQPLVPFDPSMLVTKTFTP